ncbi:hypothetical protein [Lichenihabitans psoromatis]|uniref:hypothetical protein n=1 Tax=Lichenihabitans psoromatis TaxID=2528642 RepID=UPI00103574B1|nr:hypothetical protein [Lichenihabitans psoromatis]
MSRIPVDADTTRLLDALERLSLRLVDHLPPSAVPAAQEALHQEIETTRPGLRSPGLMTWTLQFSERVAQRFAGKRP